MILVLRNQTQSKYTFLSIVFLFFFFLFSTYRNVYFKNVINSLELVLQLILVFYEPLAQDNRLGALGNQRVLTLYSVKGL